MKINSITANTGYLKGRATESERGRMSKSAKERYAIQQKNNEQINTTIKSNSDGRVNFKGNLFGKIAEGTYNNVLLAEALFALSITCFARPLTIMATAKNDEEKEKCQYQAAKSISSGLIGLGITALISPTIANATKAMEEAEFFKKIPKAVEDRAKAVGGETGKRILRNYPKTSKNLMDKLFHPIILPSRAKATIVAVPIILGALGLKKASHYKQQKNNVNFGMFQTKREKELFQSFLGVNKNENK